MVHFKKDVIYILSKSFEDGNKIASNNSGSVTFGERTLS